MACQDSNKFPYVLSFNLLKFVISIADNGMNIFECTHVVSLHVLHWPILLNIFDDVCHSIVQAWESDNITRI